MDLYARTVVAMPWLMDALEQYLANLENGAELTVADVRTNVADRLPTIDQVHAAIAALRDIGVLSELNSSDRFDRVELENTRGFRAGVRGGALAASHDPGSAVRLCAALPPGLRGDVASTIRHVAEDLRGSVVNLVTGAERELLLVSPFWDVTTVEEFIPILTHRLHAGVRIRVMGRFEGSVSDPVQQAFRSLYAWKEFQLLQWYESWRADLFGAQTFHLKAAVADRSRAYLGTANFTASGLRSRLELGVLLEGEPAERLVQVVRAVVSMGRPVGSGASSDRPTSEA